jgi:hypothetical protein
VIVLLAHNNQKYLFFCYLRANQIDENHQTDDLPEAAGGLGKGEELNYDIIPKNASNKRNNYKCDYIRHKNCYRIRVYFTLDGGVGIGETLNGGTGRGEQARHLSITGCLN